MGLSLEFSENRLRLQAVALCLAFRGLCGKQRIGGNPNTTTFQSLTVGK